MPTTSSWAGPSIPVLIANPRPELRIDVDLTSFAVNTNRIIHGLASSLGHSAPD